VAVGQINIDELLIFFKGGGVEIVWRSERLTAIALGAGDITGKSDCSNIAE
jgi:hypothetical protein